jgi:hypothetical protein
MFGRTMRSVGLAKKWGAALMALSVTACASVNEESVSSVFVTPGKYEFYTCQDITSRIQGTRNRLNELEQLMARSSQSAGGALVNAIAYRSDHTQTRGELSVLMKAAEDKRCVSESPWSSERAVF